MFKHCFSSVLNGAFAVIIITLQIKWQIIENFYCSVMCAFLERCVWFMKIMHVFCVNTMYIVFASKCSSLFEMKICFHMEALKSLVLWTDVSNHYGIWHPSWLQPFVVMVDITMIIFQAFPRCWYSIVVKDWLFMIHVIWLPKNVLCFKISRKLYGISVLYF